MDEPLVPNGAPEAIFHRMRYLRSDFRRLEHLATLRLPVEGRSVLEIGAGIGDLTSFFLDRDCTVTSVEPRLENVTRFRQRYAEDVLWPDDRLRILQSDIGGLAQHGLSAHDVVFCYSVFNFLSDPEGAIRILSDHCGELLILEVAATSGPGLLDDAIGEVDFGAGDAAGSIEGCGCSPTRRWVYERLRKHFEWVYMTRTQPAFDRFRLDWREPSTGRPRDRVIFVASRTPLENGDLVEGIPDLQERAP
jgi:hypothetical protein